MKTLTFEQFPDYAGQFFGSKISYSLIDLIEFVEWYFCSD